MKWLTTFIFVFAFALAGASRAQGAMGMGCGTMCMSMGGGAMMEAHEAMISAMQAVTPTGNTDRDFVLMMIPQHQGAIDRAKNSPATINPGKGKPRK
jgi:uncharacterized protein (DUF305 family)